MAPFGSSLLERDGHDRRRRWILALLVLAVAVPCEAQIGNASLSVHVVDEEGASVPGLVVDAVNTETGFRRAATTGAKGTAVMLALPVGPYDVSARSEGMDAPASRALILRVGQQAQLRLELQPQITDAMTVTGEIPLVDVYKMDSSTNIVPEQIESLPVLDRQYERLAFLTPGVQRDRARFMNRISAPVIGGEWTRRIDRLSHRWCRLDRQLHRAWPGTGEPGRN